MKATSRGDALISIVMPSRNQKAFLPEAIESILCQAGVRLEIIVADGASTDGTVEWLETKAKKDPRLRWFSKPDTGPAEAVNRAIRMARGSVIGWLNSDDRYVEGALQRGLDALYHDPQALMVYGHADHIDESGRRLGSYPTLPPDAPIEKFLDGCFICQPTVFFKRTFFLLNGPLDESLKTAFDFEWWLRAFSNFQDRITFVDALQAESRLHRDCITMKQRKQVMLESMSVLHRHLGQAPAHWVKTWVLEAITTEEITGSNEIFMTNLECEIRQWIGQKVLVELRKWFQHLPFKSQGQS